MYVVLGATLGLIIAFVGLYKPEVVAIYTNKFRKMIGLSRKREEFTPKEIKQQRLYSFLIIIMAFFAIILELTKS